MGKKIVFLCRGYGVVNRGAETYVQELSKQLIKLGHNVKIKKHMFSGIDVETDIIINTNGRLDIVMTRIWCLMHNTKLVIPSQSGLGWDDKLNLWLFPDVFIGLTNYQSQWAKRINPFVKIVTIPNGVDLQKFNPNVPPIKVDLPKPIVLSVGALEPIKCQDLIIKQIAQTTESLLIVGQGSLEKEIYDLGIKMLGEKRFKIMHFTHNQMPSVYTACDKFIFHSKPWESFGIVILEARASGLQVEVPSDPIRQEIINTNLQEFSWDKIAKKYEELF